MHWRTILMLDQLYDQMFEMVPFYLADSTFIHFILNR